MVTENNVTSIDISAEAFKDDQFILASQAYQVFYIEYPSRGPNWRVVQTVYHRSPWDMVGSNITEIDLLHNNYSFSLSLIVDLGNIEYISLHRDDGKVDEI
ncbi:Formin-like protein 18 [Abeliophyllum distichum]|uniref:Formin-like protein 18 n=1 Tax=Abeliophyllum distichum TaxID=126358 RepID=A0ABD1UMI7_9LAMI